MALLTFLNLTYYIYISFLDNGSIDRTCLSELFSGRWQQCHLRNWTFKWKCDRILGFCACAICSEIFQFDRFHHCGSKKVNYLSAQLIVIALIKVKEFEHKSAIGFGTYIGYYIMIIVYCLAFSQDTNEFLFIFIFFLGGGFRLGGI